MLIWHPQGLWRIFIFFIYINSIFKKGNKDCDKNYKPINLISGISKVIEGNASDNLVTHLANNKLLIDGQHGSCKGWIVVTYLLQLHNIGTKLLTTSGHSPTWSGQSITWITLICTLEWNKVQFWILSGYSIRLCMVWFYSIKPI